MIEFTVYGEPAAQGRPRFTSVNGYVRAYDPKKSSEYKTYIKLVASEYKPKETLTGALSLQVDIYRSIPKTMSKKKRLLAEEGLLRPVTKPDVDNYLKAIKDALKGIIWNDDSQVVEVKASKWYSDNPRIHIHIEEMGETK